MPQMFRTSVASDVVSTGINGNQISYHIKDTTNEIDQRNDTIYPFAAFFAACARVMSEDAMKSKEHKTAITFCDKNGSNATLMSCISEWIPTEDGSDGNFNFYFSFDVNDIKGLPEDAIKPFYQLQAIRPFAATLRDEFANTHCRSINDEVVLNGITMSIVKTICNWLDENASESEPVTVEFKDSSVYEINFDGEGKAIPIEYEEYKKHWITYATATVVVDRGVKKKSMTFGEEMKAIAKGNADLI